MKGGEECRMRSRPPPPPQSASPQKNQMLSQTFQEQNLNNHEKIYIYTQIL